MSLVSARPWQAKAPPERKCSQLPEAPAASRPQPGTQAGGQTDATFQTKSRDPSTIETDTPKPCGLKKEVEVKSFLSATTFPAGGPGCLPSRTWEEAEQPLLLPGSRGSALHRSARPPTPSSADHPGGGRGAQCRLALKPTTPSSYRSCKCLSNVPSPCPFHQVSSRPSAARAQERSITAPGTRVSTAALSTQHPGNETPLPLPRLRSLRALERLAGGRTNPYHSQAAGVRRAILHAAQRADLSQRPPPRVRWAASPAGPAWALPQPSQGGPQQSRTALRQACEATEEQRGPLPARAADCPR